MPSLFYFVVTCFTRSCSSARLALLKRSSVPTRYPVMRRMRSNGTPSPTRSFLGLVLLIIILPPFLSSIINNVSDKGRDSLCKHKNICRIEFRYGDC